MKGRRFNLDDNFFDKIDTQIKAYLLGFLYADGYNGEDFNRVSICLNIKDKEILEKFKHHLKAEIRIYFRKRKTDTICVLDLKSETLSKRLAALGCVKGKTFILRFPTAEQVPTNLLSHFIRGYFDGDGSLSYYYPREGYLYAKTNLISTRHFCETLQKFVIETLKIKGSVLIFGKKHKNPKFPIRRYDIGGNRQVEVFLDWLYKDSSIHLERKYLKYLEFSRLNRQQKLEYSTRRGIVMTFKKAEHIRKEYEMGGTTQRKLGKKYGVSQTTILDILNKNTWKKENRLQNGLTQTEF